MANSQQFPLKVAILLAMTMALGPLALDTYLPAFPAMAVSLATSHHQIGLSIAIYVFVLALGQLIAGPLSDRFGRARIMLTGLGIFAIASLLITLAESLQQLLLLRALQAFGGGWTAVCVPAIVRDRLTGNEAARFFSLIGLIMIVAPAIAPSIGSVIIRFYDWPAIFLLLGVYALLLTLLLKVLMFRKPHPQAAFNPAITMWQRYRTVFATRPAMRFMLLQTLAFSVMLLFITHSSFIYQQHFGVKASNFALLFGANVIFMIVMNLCNRRWLKRFPPARILRWSLSLQAFGLLCLLLVLQLHPVLWLVVPAMIITVGAMGAITPNTQACYMDFFPEHGGTAAALLGATQFSIGGLIAAASSLLPESVMAIAMAQAICSGLCLLLVWSRNYIIAPHA